MHAAHRQLQRELDRVATGSAFLQLVPLANTYDITTQRQMPQYPGRLLGVGPINLVNVHGSGRQKAMS
jgi:hypothetical protein